MFMLLTKIKIADLSFKLITLLCQILSFITINMFKKKKWCKPNKLMLSKYDICLFALSHRNNKMIIYYVHLEGQEYGQNILIIQLQCSVASKKFLL